MLITDRSIVSCVGYNSLYAIISNLGAIIGYWTIIYFAILCEEQILFRRRIGWDLLVWNDKHSLPFGYAAGLAFCFGVAGSVVGMAQTWYTGPIGAMIGEYGGDLGVELGFAFTAITYPAFRWCELKRFGR